MKKGYLVLLLLQLMVFPLSCSFGRNNPFDEGGTNFTPPKIIINQDASSVKNMDTVHFDSVIIVLSGNREQCLFSMKVDSGNWSADWRSADTFGFGGLADGNHTLFIHSMYRGGEMVVADSISFYVLTKGFKPEFAVKTDTAITTFAGKSVTLIASAKGASPLNYSWLKGTTIISGMFSDTLSFISFLSQDTATYRCITSNEYGKDTSRIFMLKYRPSTGSIKGTVTDAVNNKKLSSVQVTLLPGIANAATDTNGLFEFKGLSGKPYSLMITCAGYFDSIIVGISVNDTETLVLPTIAISKAILSNVIYDGNGNDSGTVPIDGNSYKPGMVVTLRGNSGKLSKVGYSFAGWNKTKDGKGTQYAPADTFSIGKSDDTFFAVWQVNQYTLTLNGNKNTAGNPPETKSYDFNASITIPDKGNLERPGYSFSGWNENEQGTGKDYTGGQSFKMADTNIVLFAKWIKLQTFNFTYLGNDNTAGTVPSDTNSYYTGQKVTVAGNPGNLLKDGFSFAGWTTSAEGTGESYNAGSTFSMPSSPDTLFAKWTNKPTYSIVYNGNLNTGGNAPATVNSDSGATITIADSGSLFKTGYSFTGWNTLGNGNGIAYTQGDKKVMDTVSITLYAQWVESRYTLTYHGNGHTNGTPPPSTNHLHGSVVPVASAGSLEKTGHSFYCWNTDSTGTGIDYAAGSSLSMNSGNIDLYARWQMNGCIITYNSQGGTSIEKQTVTFGSMIVPPTEPVKRSYTFAGWYKDSLCIVKFNFYKNKITTDVTFYAKWAIMDVDGNVYTEVKIGNQVWMVENLKTTKFNDGTSIPNVPDYIAWSNLLTPGYCWFGNDSATNKNPYGALYNWYVVEPSNTKAVAPAGWHVPSDAEWDTLLNYLIANGYNYDGTTTGNKVAKSLAAKTSWNTNSDTGTIGNDSIKNNRSGFSAFPGGYRYIHRNNWVFGNIGYNGYWWSITENDATYAWCHSLNFMDVDLHRQNNNKCCGSSVRCVRD